MSKQECKARYFLKKYQEAKEIICICGCGQKLKEFNHYGRRQQYINGHNGRKYIDPTQYKREWNHRNRSVRYQAKKKRYHHRRIALIKYKGAKCTECLKAYDGTNAPIFHMHHLDPKTKLFNFSSEITDKSWEVLIAEANKCILLCANCHEMKHGDHY